MQPVVKKQNLLYPELSYTIIGCAFDIYNALGSGFLEKVYQKAMKEAFIAKGIAFEMEISFPIMYNDTIIGKKGSISSSIKK
jgi:GxxExxY protein